MNLTILNIILHPLRSEDPSLNIKKEKQYQQHKRIKVIKKQKAKEKKEKTAQILKTKDEANSIINFVESLINDLKTLSTIIYQEEWDLMLQKNSEQKLNDLCICSFFRVFLPDNQLIDSLISVYLNNLVNNDKFDRSMTFKHINSQITRNKRNNNLLNLFSIIERLEGDIFYWPYHYKDHWILFIINLNQLSINIFDSFGKSNCKININIAGWISWIFSQAKQIHNLIVDVTITKKFQTNGYDCGVWICLFAFLHYHKMVNSTIHGKCNQRCANYFRPKMLQILKRFDPKNQLHPPSPSQSYLIDDDMDQGTLEYLFGNRKSLDY